MDVDIKLDGKTETLRCTLKAAKRVNAAGGFSQVIGRLQSADLEYFSLVVAAGLDKQPSEVEARVYRTGLPALGADLAKYANLLANGGKPFRPMKLKTVEIEGKVYAEINDRGDPMYVEDEPAEAEAEGEA